MKMSWCVRNEEDGQERVGADSLCFVYTADISSLSKRGTHPFFLTMLCVTRNRPSLLAQRDRQAGQAN